MFPVSSRSCLCAIYWSQMLIREWRCSWSRDTRTSRRNIWIPAYSDMRVLSELHLKIGALQTLFQILLFRIQSLFVTAGNARYTKQPIYGHRCIASTNITLWQTKRPQCVWKCLGLKTCQCINHNHGTGQCDLGLGKCESLEPTVGSAVNVFGPPRDNCVRWGSKHDPGRVPVQMSFDRFDLYLARIMINDILLIGSLISKNRMFWANNEGYRVGPIQETDQTVGFLTVGLWDRLIFYMVIPILLRRHPYIETDPLDSTTEMACHQFPSR